MTSTRTSTSTVHDAYDAHDAYDVSDVGAVDAIDLFAGWGGMTLGAQQAGCRVRWSANHWPLAVQTHALNHPDTTHVCQDLRQADWTTLPNYRLLLAAPACQGHSPASRPKRRAFHDALRATAFAVIDCADATEPDAIVVENVPSFLDWRLASFWVGALEHLGYQVEARILNAADFGVPQLRRRLFMIATRPGHKAAPTPPTGARPAIGPHLDLESQHHWRSVRQASPAIRERIARGRARHGHTFLTQHVTGHSGVSLNEPIRTVTTACSHWHLVEGSRYRPLTGRELARAMGFPDDYLWPEDATAADVTTGLGNAVPPPLARAVVGAVVAGM